MKSFPFNSSGGDRKYDAQYWREYFLSFISNGVFPNPSSGLQVIANDDMTVTVQKGKCFINGVHGFNEDRYILELDYSDGLLNRIDRIVARLDYQDREVRLEIKQGEFSKEPLAPQLQRDANAYELAIADILVSKGAISIFQENITDLRLNNELCGIVHGTVDQVDTTTIFNQYLDWYKRFTKNSEDEFWKWFTNLKLNIDKYIESEINDFHEWCQKTQGVYEIFQDTETQKFLAWCEKTRNDYDFFKDTQTQNFLKWFENLKNMLEDNQASNLQAQIDDIRTVRWGKSLYTWGWLKANKVTWADLASGFPVEYQTSRFDTTKLLTKVEAEETYSTKEETKEIDDKFSDYSTKEELKNVDDKFNNYATKESVDNIFPVTWGKLAGKKEE